MDTSFLQYVAGHPPRCIAQVNPKPVCHVHPTLVLPPSLSIYRSGRYSAVDTATFAIGCPCGAPTAMLTGFYALTDSFPPNGVFVGPLGIECLECDRATGFFDSREHGFDGEQGCNTHLIGEGIPDRFTCPSCRLARMSVYANFSYHSIEELDHAKWQHSKDYFSSFDVVGQCAGCSQVMEIASFECS